MMDFDDSYVLLSEEQLIYIITIPLSTSIILANLVIILGISWNRQLHNTPNYFFLSLLVADLCTGVALPFIPLMGLNRHLSFSSCLVAHVFPNFLFLAFLFNLVMVHYERYICIIDPLHYSNLWMHRSFPLTLLVVWTPALLYASLPAFGWNNWTGPDFNSCCESTQNLTAFSNCLTNTTSCCSYKRVFPNAFIFLEVYGLVLPAILAIAAMTGHVLWITRGQLKDICRLHRSVERGNQASDQEQKLNLRYTRCVVAVSLTFLACWVPYLIYMHVSIALVVSDSKRSSTTHIVLSCTGIGSMAVVPIVLGLANRQYTEPALKLLQKLRDRWRPRTQASEEATV
ncbi:G-protein coupled bile acid receptor 1 [Oreochromis niloticus]|nr:G-protein coupled bile acid receptor 1 [Oreochromis niloticus]XP_005463137.1 G-protein coupled bile acid receptor 1 [Oreochromis niloticus]XP_013121475.1 G-protein coupled bile acid receptor 1 [Oreochromis niloticus]XP_019207716.1 G-protein coupled bile acid receptor 1 [Oreochromis niloticus]XP_025758553.1 G-protein coupled bile acid receptor 1 [Oreochromis niloticus]XP_031599253.1 G-protein coupled bile acid receptor 1 isoform X2 [Oreochromis aureus]XP_039462500.1 G-protein coupled bile a